MEDSFTPFSAPCPSEGSKERPQPAGALEALFPTDYFSHEKHGDHSSPVVMSDSPASTSLPSPEEDRHLGTEMTTVCIPEMTSEYDDTSLLGSLTWSVTPDVETQDDRFPLLGPIIGHLPSSLRQLVPSLRTNKGHLSEDKAVMPGSGIYVRAYNRQYEEGRTSLKIGPNWVLSKPTGMPNEERVMNNVGHGEGHGNAMDNPAFVSDDFNVIVEEDDDDVQVLPAVTLVVEREPQSPSHPTPGHDAVHGGSRQDNSFHAFKDKLNSHNRKGHKDDMPVTPRRRAMSDYTGYIPTFYLKTNNITEEYSGTTVDEILDKIDWTRNDDAVVKSEDTTGPSKDEKGDSEEKPTAVNEDSKWLEWIQQKFADIAGEEGEIDLNAFKTALNVKKSFFAERFFALFDSDSSGSIELAELMNGLILLSKGTPRQKLKFLFDVYDVDGGGTIDFGELKTVLISCMDESSLQLTDENLEDLTRALFESADEDNSGSITFEELVTELQKFPGVLENLTISAANWLKPPESKQEKKKFAMPRYFSRRYLQNNLRKVMFLLIYWLVNIGLFILNAVRYKDNNGWVIVARGAGMVLNFNGTFVVVLMLRSCLTWLRTTRVGHYLPLDQTVLFHKMVGLVIAFFTLVHTVAHLVNIGIVMKLAKVAPAGSPLVKYSHLEYWEFLFTLRSGIGWIGPGFGFLSGVLLDIILIVMVICSMPFVRRSGHFQVFYWSHTLYIPFWVLLILHGPIFWCFFIVPGIIFIIERINVSRFCKLARFGHVKIIEVSLLPSRVTHLVIKRPKRFRYKPGDYIFVSIPKIAKYEWHPFTISSAPETLDEVWLHVRSVGHWTNKLYDYFDTHDAPLVTTATIKGATSRVARKFKKKTKKVSVEVFIDGPYGTSTREIFDSEHAVLIASGIGVTPYASILQSVHKRYIAYKKACPRCRHEWYGEVPPNVMRLKTVDFVWINRDQKCFEWFVSLLSQMEMNQKDDWMLSEEERENNRFIKMHMYITSALGKTDMKGVGLQMAMEILHKKEGRDLITGLQCRTQAGRPDWKELFGSIDRRKKGKVNVFYCGSPQIAKSLKGYCETFKFNFSKENF